MARIVILIAIIGIGLLMWFKIKNAKGEDRKKLIIWSFAIAAISILGILAATGRLTYITAIIGGFIALLPKLFNVLRYLPLLNRFRQQYSQHQGGQQGSGQQAGRTSNAMNREKAADILGIKPDASKQEIITAHKRMMQKLHPDRGGSDYLAAEINKAKDTLLG